ncbi:uncharacterized protein LOC131632666 [Vicia villosa]|uniref:uncharacterized protein LOC131632666 n=1 Tax=Vicia villosa TaxID=3911 RepID=UPI00273CA26D|nr:uncharacterized protein LOC131632666 [Vicia villosa]
MDSTMTIIENHSISMPPYFDGKNFTEWQKSMMLFIQSVDFKLWLVINNGIKIPKKVENGEESEKSENEYDDEDVKIMEQESKAKYILCCALNPHDRKRISCCKTAKDMWEELDKLRKVPTPNVNPIVVVSENDPPALPPKLNTPNLEFLKETVLGDNLEKKFLELCVPIHKLALKGNWPAAKHIILNKENKLKNAAITKDRSTLLHIAAGANQIKFVTQLLKMLPNNDLELQDINGNTAFSFAAAAGNIEIVNLMVERNPLLPTIRGVNGYTPIMHAALQGRCKMTWHLYDKTIHCFEEKDWNLLFFACIYSGIYGKY